MPTIGKMQELVSILEKEKGFSRELRNKLIRLQEEVAEVMAEHKEDVDTNKLAEELIDCIFFICSALSILKVDGDKLFMDKWKYNMTRVKGEGLDTFKR